MYPFRSSVCKFFVVLFLIPLVCSRLVTRYIDDTYGDSMTSTLVYFGTGQWISGSDIHHGTLQPDPAKAFNGTWHDSTRFEGMPSYGFKFSFTGVSFTIFCILPNSPTNIMPNPSTDLTFTVDDEPAGSYSYTSNDSNEFVYDAPVLSMDNMANKEHNVTVEISVSPSLVLFDYVAYILDIDDDEPEAISNSTSTRTGDNLPTPTQGKPPSNQAIRLRSATETALVFCALSWFLVPEF